MAAETLKTANKIHTHAHFIQKVSTYTGKELMMKETHETISSSVNYLNYMYKNTM